MRRRFVGRSPMVPCSRSDGGISLLIRNKGVQGERNLPIKLHRNLDRVSLRDTLSPGRMFLNDHFTSQKD